MAFPSLASPAAAEPTPEQRKITRGLELVARYALAAIVLALPLEFTAIFLKQPLVRWLFIPAGIAAAYLVASGRWRITLPRQPSAVLLAMFIAFALASWLLTRAPSASRQVVDALMYPVAGLLFLNLARTESDHLRVWIAFLVSGLAVALLGFLLYVTHTTIWTPNPLVAHRLNITFADPNITARFLTLCGAASVLMFAARQGPRWLAVTVALACAVVIPMTWSRSGLALYVFTVLLAIVAAQERRRAAVIGVCALLAFLGSTGINPDTRQRAVDAATTLVSTVTGTAHNLSTSQPSTTSQDTFALEDNRRYLVAAGAKMFLDHPVTGVGFGGYQHALVTGYHRFLPPNVPNPDTVSHTAFVTTLAELGGVGALILVAFLVELARELLRSRRTLWTTMPAILVVPIFLYSQFEGRFLEEPYLWLCLGLFYSAMLLEERHAATRLAEDNAEQHASWSRSQTA